MTVRPPASRLGRHALVLAAIVLGLLPLVGSEAVWSADVGAQLRQSSLLLDGNGWTSSHPIPEVDPEGHYFGLHLAQRPVLAAGDPHRYVALAKHPFLTWGVAGLLSIGGLTAVLVVSALGTVAAAVATGRITELVRPDLAPWALWVTGLLSPLLFDAYIGYAHTIAAAAVAWSCYFALRSLDGDREWPHRLAAAALIAIGCLARTEGALAAVALAVAVTSLNLVRQTPVQSGRSSHRRPWLTGLAVVVGASTAVIVDRLAALAVSGPANPAWRPATPSFFLGRWLGFAQTWLNPGRRLADLLIVVAAFAVITAAVASSRATRVEATSTSGPMFKTRLVPVIAAVIAVVAVAARAAVAVTAAEPVMVSGLLFAFPVLAAGLFVVRRSHFNGGPSQVCVVAFGLYAAAVIATQYSYGGVAEWGGRYFAAGIPLGVAATIAPLADVVSRLPARTRTMSVSMFAVAGLGLNVLGLASLNSVRQSTADLVQEIETTTELMSGNDEPKPVVVSTVPLAGRVSWAIFDDARWLLVDSSELPQLAARLQQHDIDQFALVTFRPEADTAMLAGQFAPDNSSTPVSAGQRQSDSKLIPGEAVVVMNTTANESAE